MYQAVAYQRRTNTVHVWDDQKGHVQIKYKPYAYAPNANGQHVALDGTRLTKVTRFDNEDTSLYESDLNPEVRTLIDLYPDSDEISVGHRTLFIDIEVDIAEAPGIGMTDISFFTHWFINNFPGSEIDGVPASEINDTILSSLIISITLSKFFFSLNL